MEVRCGTSKVVSKTIVSLDLRYHIFSKRQMAPTEIVYLAYVVRALFQCPIF